MLLSVGCLIFAGGLVWADHTLSSHPSFGALAASLGVVGVGLGLTVVPITDTALSAAPARFSGMAASATNTSRELGAVVGVAVLDAIVNSRLTGDLVGALHRLNIPDSFQGLIINAVEQGGLPSGSGSGPAVPGGTPGGDRGRGGSPSPS